MAVSPPPSTTTRRPRMLMRPCAAPGSSSSWLMLDMRKRRASCTPGSSSPAKPPLEAEVGADLETQAELDAHALHDLAPRLHDLLLQLEGRDTEGEQPADARVAVEHDRLHAVAHQDVRARKSCRSCADHRHALTRGAHVRHVG